MKTGVDKHLTFNSENLVFWDGSHIGFIGRNPSGLLWDYVWNHNPCAPRELWRTVSLPNLPQVKALLRTRAERKIAKIYR